MGSVATGVAQGIYSGAEAFARALEQKRNRQFLEREKKATELLDQIHATAANAQALPRDEKGEIIRSPQYQELETSGLRMVQQYRQLFGDKPQELVEHLKNFKPKQYQKLQKKTAGLPTWEGEQAAAPRPAVQKEDWKPQGDPYRVGGDSGPYYQAFVNSAGKVQATRMPEKWTPGAKAAEEWKNVGDIFQYEGKTYQRQMNKEGTQFRAVEQTGPLPPVEKSSPRQTFEEQTYEEWIKDPKNKGKTRLDFLKERTPERKSFEEETYEDWSKDPKNKGKNRAAFLKEKAGWGMEATAGQVTDIADGVESGKIAPDLSTLGAMGGNLKGRVTAELARRGYNQTQATVEYKTVQRHMATVNSTQQLRLRQAIEKIEPHTDLIESIYSRLKKKNLPTGFKVWNRAALAAARNIPGETGALATNLEAQINDLSAELGNVYMGGNTPTDHALEMAAKNLASEWNPETFAMAIDLIRKNVVMRRNAIQSIGPAGISGESPYLPMQPKGDVSIELERGPDGKLREKKNP